MHKPLSDQDSTPFRPSAPHALGCPPPVFAIWDHRWQASKKRRPGYNMAENPRNPKTSWRGTPATYAQGAKSLWEKFEGKIMYH